MGLRYAGAMAVVMLARFASLPEAFVVRAALEAAGVNAFMPEQGWVAQQGATDMMGGWPIFVIDDDLDVARAVLIEAQSGVVAESGE
jgi:hypothetical protein